MGGGSAVPIGTSPPPPFFPSPPPGWFGRCSEAAIDVPPLPPSQSPALSNPFGAERRGAGKAKRAPPCGDRCTQQRVARWGGGGGGPCAPPGALPPHGGHRGVLGGRHAGTAAPTGRITAAGPTAPRRSAAPPAAPLLAGTHSRGAERIADGGEGRSDNSARCTETHFKLT